MIDATLLLGAELKPSSTSWTHRDAIIYALGVGITDLGPRGLSRLYEKDLQVLPTFGCLAGMADVEEFTSLPGADFHYSKLLHAQHEVELHRVVPANARDVVRTGKVVGVHDKGRAAMVVLDTDLVLEGAPFVTTRTTCFVQGEGGFDARVGELPRERPATPERTPDAVVRVPTTAIQAAVYRLSGDWNQLHIDPEVAAMVGLERPILQGMCSFGIAVTSVIDAILDGKAELVRRFGVRFTGMAYPGDTLETRAWKVEGGAVFESVASNRDDAPILSGGGVFTTASPTSATKEN